MELGFQESWSHVGVAEMVLESGMGQKLISKSLWVLQDITPFSSSVTPSSFYSIGLGSSLY